MAIGRISSPTTPIPVGTVASPTWATSVEDNINGLLDGTGPTLKALQIDGVGGAASITSPGNLAVSGQGVFGAGIAVTGNSLVTGTFGSTVATTKKVWIPGSAFVASGASSLVSYGNTLAAITVASSPVTVRVGLCFPYSSSGSATVVQVDVFVFKNSASGTTVNVKSANVAAAGVDAVVGTTTFSSAGFNIITIGSLSAVSDDTHQIWLDVSCPATGDSVYGVRCTYTSAVF